MEGLGAEPRRGARRPHIEAPASRIANEARAGRHQWRTSQQSATPPTFPRKFADVDLGSRKINPNKICAECWPGAAFGPCWLLTERLRYETTPLLPALRDRVHVHGQRDDSHGSHCGSHSASSDNRAAGASRRHEHRHWQG